MKGTYNVDVAELIKPEVVRGTSSSHEITVCKLFVDLSRGNIQLMENPAFRKAFPACRLQDVSETVVTSRIQYAYLGKRFRYERLVEFEHSELCGVEDLVAEFTVAFYTQDLQVDVPTCVAISASYRTLRNQLDVPPPLYAHRANRKASVPHWGIPLGKSFF